MCYLFKIDIHLKYKLFIYLLNFKLSLNLVYLFI